MKQISVYLLLLVFLMYQAGFYFFYLSLHHINEESWQNPENVSERQNQYIEKSIPITFAYQHDQTEYQSVMQSIEVNDSYYRVVMQRYANDTLHVLYVIDSCQQNLHNSLKDWVSTISQQSSHDKKSMNKEGLEKNYLPESLMLNLSNSYVPNAAYNFSFIPDILVNTPETLKPPPKIS
jgi:hypothetical protein